MSFIDHPLQGVKGLSISDQYGELSEQDCCNIDIDMGVANGVSINRRPGLLRRTIPSLLGISPGVKVESADYNCLGSVKQLKNANDLMHVSGNRLTEAYVGAPVGADMVVNMTPSASLMHLGVQITWSIQLQNASTFTAGLQLNNVFSAPVSSNRLDRSLELTWVPQAIGDKSMGGVIFLLNAYRAATGMQIANTQVALTDLAQAPPTEVRITNVPAALLAVMSVTTRYITAFSPQVAALMAGIGVYRGDK